MKRAFSYYINQCVSEACLLLFQCLFYLLLDIGHLLCRFKTGNDLTFLVDEEFGKVPLDVCFLLVVRISLGEHVVEDVGNGVLHIPACETFLFLEEFEEGVGIVAIDLDLLKAWEFRSEVEFAELVDALVCTRGLLAELVAREIEDLKSLTVILLV